MPLITHARALRRGQTDAERLLWYHLRGKRLQGHKFRRQHPYGRYILDFVCLEARLVIERMAASIKAAPLIASAMPGWRPRASRSCASGTTTS